MDLRSIRTFNYEEYARRLTNQATSYTVAGIPVITYGCLGLTAGLLGVMFFYEDDNKKESEAKAEPEAEAEAEAEAETPSPEEQTGGKKKRKTRRRKMKKRKR